MSNSALLEQFLKLTNFQLAWEQVAENQGCAGVDGETISHFGQHEDEYLVRLSQAVSTGEYRPMPLRQLFVPKQDGSWRELGVPTVRDRIVQQALLNVLHPIMEPQFEPCSFAYRPGRSHLMAVRQVAYWRDRGYEQVLDADLVEYFDNMLHQRLLAEVAERLNHPDFLALIQDWISAGLLTKAGLLLPDKGVPQGAVISPLLSNIYLDDFDEILSATKLKLVRYADNFLLMARHQEQVVEAKAMVAQLLTGIGLQLHPDKTQIANFKHGFRFLGQVFVGNLIVPVKKAPESAAAPVVQKSIRLIYADPVTRPTAMQQALVSALKASHQPIPPPLFVVLGYAVRPEKTVKIESKETPWRTGMATLYLVHPETTLRRAHLRFLVQVPEEPDIEIPIREMEQILVFGNVQLTTAVISTCLEAQIPVVFLSQMGEYKGHLWNSEFCDLQAEAKQFQLRDDAAFQQESARAIVWGKLMNSKQLLLRLNRKRQLQEVSAVISGITADIEAVETVENLESLRGYEGTAAKRYFQALGQLLIQPGFSFTERNRRPPKDPINSLLSFGYTLLFNNVLSLILAEGLNPYLGNLHRSDRKEPHLVLDLMEEFRSPVVDSLVMTVVNKQVIKPTDFTWPNAAGGIYLNDQARRVFLKYFEQRMSDLVAHLDVQEKVSYRRAIHLQVKRYKRTLLESTPYQAFLRSV